MKGKTLENLVLAVGLIVIGTAIFFMYFAPQMLAARLINIIFSIGFIIYIAYSYILSNNLNSEINGLQKIVDNLKSEVGRQKETIAKRDKNIAQLSSEVNDLTTNLTTAQTELASKTEALEVAIAELAELKKDAEKEE